MKPQSSSGAGKAGGSSASSSASAPSVRPLKVKLTSYVTNFKAALRKGKMLESDKTMLATKDSHIFHCHKSILTTFSTNLRKLYEGLERNGLPTTVVYLDVSHGALHKVLKYMYEGQMVLNDVDEARAVGNLATNLKVIGFRDDPGEDSESEDDESIDVEIKTCFEREMKRQFHEKSSNTGEVKATKVEKIHVLMSAPSKTNEKGRKQQQEIPIPIDPKVATATNRPGTLDKSVPSTAKTNVYGETIEPSIASILGPYEPSNSGATDTRLEFHAHDVEEDMSLGGDNLENPTPDSGSNSKMISKLYGIDYMDFLKFTSNPNLITSGAPSFPNGSVVSTPSSQNLPSSSKSVARGQKTKIEGVPIKKMKLDDSSGALQEKLTRGYEAMQSGMTLMKAAEAVGVDVGELTRFTKKITSMGKKAN